jgi:probable rRNA maturation factor
VILERKKSKELSRLALARFAARAQREVGLAGEVTVLVTGDAELRQLNRDFRGKDKPTDVLSFPSAAETQPRGRKGGDIAISLDRAKAQAREMNHPLLVEVKVLILHGMLHLSGLDHETDSGRMERRERLLRAKLNLPSGLIERTAGQGRG